MTEKSPNSHSAIKRRTFGSDTFICGTEKILYDKVIEKLIIKTQTAVDNKLNIVYAKARRIEQEILAEEPPQEILNMKSPHRLQVISKSCHMFGFKRQGKHSCNPLWKMVI